jgi:hypothetical protein
MTTETRERERRIRKLNDRLGKLESEMRSIKLELSPLERDESRSLGFIFGGTLKGDRLIAEMDRRQGMRAKVAL